MKNGLWLVVVMLVIVGCGKKEPETKFSGVEAPKKDYITDAMNYLSDSDIPNAIASFDSAIKQDPTNVQNYLILGEVYLRLNQFVRAEDTFSAATKVDPNNAEVYYLLARSRAVQEGKRELAVEAAKKSAELYLAQNEQEKFRRSVIFVQSLTSQVQPVAAE